MDDTDFHINTGNASSYIQGNSFREAALQAALEAEDEAALQAALSASLDQQALEESFASTSEFSSTEYRHFPPVERRDTVRPLVGTLFLVPLYIRPTS